MRWILFRSSPSISALRSRRLNWSAISDASKRPATPNKVDPCSSVLPTIEGADDIP